MPPNKPGPCISRRSPRKPSPILPSRRRAAGPCPTSLSSICKQPNAAKSDEEFWTFGGSAPAVGRSSTHPRVEHLLLLRWDEIPSSLFQIQNFEFLISNCFFPPYAVGYPLVTPSIA